jgi:glycosyltransferase involved in cell wall biosynthesis
MRAAIIHYWLLRMRGGEKVVESLCRLLPEADLFTLFYDPEAVSPLIRSRRVAASRLNPLRCCYRSMLPLMPIALEHFDLRGYNLIVSSESGPAKGVLAPAGARHVCYCHSPMRYLWELYPEHLEWTPRWKRALMAPVAHYLRMWDAQTAARVDQFAANSENVRRRIRRAWGREAIVVHPPVDVEAFQWRPPQDYFLIVSELVPYKRIDLAVRAFSRSGRKLRIAGDGPEYRRLRAQAGGSVTFCGRVSDGELRDLYAGARAFVQPGEEDFGMATVEAIASGKPVIALGRGGVLEAAPPEGAFLFDAPEEAALEDAVARFEAAEHDIPRERLQQWSRRFSEAEFHRKMRAILIPEATT